MTIDRYKAVLSSICGLVLMAWLGLAAAPLFAPMHVWANPLVAKQTGEIVLGNADAPVTIIEYSSLTCNHCGAFHANTLPIIKRDYVDTGKVKFYFRHFPLDRYAATAAMMVECVSPQTRASFMDALFKRQPIWMRADDPLRALQNLGKQAGLSGEEFVMCQRNEEILADIRATMRAASDTLEVSSTPTFFVNGEKLIGNVGLAEFRKVLDKHVAEQAGKRPSNKEKSQ